jgi:hypothetical protein
MRQIKSFNVLQTAKVLGVVYFAVGLVVSLFIVFINLTVTKGPRHTGLVIAVLLPFLYGGTLFIFTAVFCWLYNFIAKRLGGIEVEVIESP